MEEVEGERGDDGGRDTSGATSEARGRDDHEDQHERDVRVVDRRAERDDQTRDRDRRQRAERRPHPRCVVGLFWCPHSANLAGSP